MKRGRLAKHLLAVSLMRSIRLALEATWEGVWGSEDLAAVWGRTPLPGCLRHLPEWPSVVEMAGMPFIPFTGTGRALGSLASVRVCTKPEGGFLLSYLGGGILWGRAMINTLSLIDYLTMRMTGSKYT